MWYLVDVESAVVTVKIYLKRPKQVMGFPTKRISISFVSSLPISTQSFGAVSSSPAFIEINRKRLNQVPVKYELPQSEFQPNSFSPSFHSVMCDLFYALYVYSLFNHKRLKQVPREGQDTQAQRKDAPDPTNSFHV